MNRLPVAPLLPQIFFGLVAFIFLFKMINDIRLHGGEFLGQDTSSEMSSSLAATNYLKDGFTSSAFLPKYGGPNNENSPSQPILESPYYTHFFPGPDLLLGFVYKVFGSDPTVTKWARLLPMLHVFLAVMLLCLLAETLIWQRNPWIKGVAAAFLLFPPAMRPWALHLHGHAYTSSYILFGLCLGLVADRQKLRSWLPICAFILGFFSIYMLMTSVFVVFAAPFVASLLVPNREASFHRQAAWLSFWVGVGLVAAFAVHFLQIVNLFSLHDAILDQFGTALVRASGNRNGSACGRGQILGQYSNHVYGFFGLSSLSMFLGGAFMAWLYRGPKRDRMKLFFAILGAGIASYFWVIVMHGHACGHLHVNPRIFYLMYSVFIMMAGVLAAMKLNVHEDVRA